MGVHLVNLQLDELVKARYEERIQSWQIHQ